MERSAIAPLKYDHEEYSAFCCSRPAPSNTYVPLGAEKEPVAVDTRTPSRYNACPGTRTAWCHAPSVTEPGETSVLVVVPAPCSRPLLAIHNSGVDSGEMQNE